MALALVSMAVFIAALQLLKTGARPLEPVIRDHLRVKTMWDGLGFGWLSAAAILSGSPVAAMSVALQGAGVIDGATSFGMINGSRIGAAFIVLLIGFIYTLRGTDRRSGLSVGLLSLLVAQTVHFPALAIGLALLKSGTLDALPFGQIGVVTSLVDRVFDPPVKELARLLPDWTLFFIGLGLMIASFRLFDQSIPEMTLDDDGLRVSDRLLRRPMLMFGLGLAVTFVTLSVSISLGLLVPLAARNIVRREHVIPYIMGAGISTFIDTFVAALILQNPAAIQVVAVEMLTILLVSLVYIGPPFAVYERAVLAVEDYLLGHLWAFGLYLAAFVLFPLAIIVL